MDGFRAVAYVSDGQCRLESRRENVYKSFDGLRTAIAQELHVKNAILDGEICCLDALGRSQFKQLLFRRGNPCFYAFDLLWLNGRDLRQSAARTEELYDLAGISNFKSFLSALGDGDWADFYNVARTPTEISFRRPFYPFAPGNARQLHLLNALRLNSIDDLQRECERKQITRRSLKARKGY